MLETLSYFPISGTRSMHERVRKLENTCIIRSQRELEGLLGNTAMNTKNNANRHERALPKEKKKLKTRQKAGIFLPHFPFSREPVALSR